MQIKLIDRLRATRWTPPDYWQTDNSNGLVMVIRLISTCSAPLVQTGECKKIFNVWPWPLTYDLSPRLAKVKVDHHAKNQGQSSNGSNRRAPTDKRTDTQAHTHGRYQSYYLPCYAVDNNDQRSTDDRRLLITLSVQLCVKNDGRLGVPHLVTRVCWRQLILVLTLHSGIVSKRLNIGSRKQRRTIAPWL